MLKVHLERNYFIRTIDREMMMAQFVKIRLKLPLTIGMELTRAGASLKSAIITIITDDKQNLVLFLFNR